jgi:ligand-binding sensor domain-containing protein
VFEDNKLEIISGKESLPSGSYHSSIKLPDGSIIFGGNILNSEGKSILVWVSNMGVDTIQIPFLLNNPFVNCIALVNRRDIWIGTASGLLVNERGRWSHYTVREGLHDNFIATIYQDFRKTIWIGTEQGISYFIDSKLYQVGQGSRVISAASQFFGDSRGYVWCGSRFSSEGVSVFNGEVWETFSGRNGLVDNSASIFFQDHTGRLWVGSCYHRSRGGVSVFDGNSWKGYSAEDVLAKPCVDAIIADSKERIWFGGSLSSRRGSGITILDGETWHTIGNSKDFPAERVISFFLDSTGQVWVSSFEGLFIVSPSYNFLTE